MIELSPEPRVVIPTQRSRLSLTPHIVNDTEGANRQFRLFGIGDGACECVCMEGGDGL